MSLFQQMQFMADGFVAKGDALGVFEFWFNRYQTLFAGVLALIAAVIGGIFVDRAARASMERDHARLLQIQAEARVAAVVAINPCVHAAAVSLSNIRDILKHVGEPTLNKPLLLNIERLRVGLSLNRLSIFRFEKFHAIWKSMRVCNS
jgi:hypothetical protein